MDSYQSASGNSHPDNELSVAATKFRVRFEKTGDMRFISHHDLMHCVERMFRRARIPLRTTQGFNPKPRIVFALSLSLGVVGRNEVLEVETEQPLASSDLLSQLSPHALSGLNILSVRPLPPKSSGRVSHIGYRVPLPELIDQTAVITRIETLLNQSECWVERARPKPRFIDLRPAIRRLEIADRHLEMEFWVFDNGTPRPQEILHALGINSLLEDGAVLERYKLELLDEQPSPVAQTLGELPVRKMKKDRKHAPSETSEKSNESASPEMLISGPLSFDS